VWTVILSLILFIHVFWFFTAIENDCWCQMHTLNPFLSSCLILNGIASHISLLMLYGISFHHLIKSFLDEARMLFSLTCCTVIFECLKKNFLTRSCSSCRFQAVFFQPCEWRFSQHKTSLRDKSLSFFLIRRWISTIFSFSFPGH